MKRSLGLTMVLVALPLLAPLAHAEHPQTQPAAKTVAAKAPAVPPIYAALNLTPEQKTQLLAKLETGRANYADWQSKHSTREKELKEELEKLREAKADQKKIAAATQELNVLKKERQELLQRNSDDAESVLTPEQRKVFKGNNLYAAWMYSFSKLNIPVSDAQKAEIRARATKAGNELEGKDAAAQLEIKNAYKQAIDKEVLTEEQRESLKPKPKTGGMEMSREPKPPQEAKPHTGR